MISKVTNYCDWHDQGIVDQIIYSTWSGELNRYPGLRKTLGEYGVTILEIEEPRLILKGGHQLHQMLALHYGLAALNNPDQFVLKTRVDLADNHELMLYDFIHGTSKADDFGGFGLKHRILVEYAQMLYPFLCGDAQFFGHLCDLQKMLNLSAEMELIMNRLAVEQTFFFHPFRDSKYFQQHFFWNLPHISEIANCRDEQLKVVFDSPTLGNAIKAWWLMLDSYFKLGWGDYCEKIPNFSSIFDAFAFNGEEKIIGSDKSDVMVRHSFVSALKELIPQDEKEYLKILISQKGRANPFAIEKVVFDAYEGFRECFSDLCSPKAVALGDRRFKISGAAQHFFVKNTKDEANHYYHEQITYLRRENDFLKKKLNITLTSSFFHRFLNRLLPRQCIEYLKSRMPWVVDFYVRYLMKKRS
jgi:hypothetical protein